ncbi:7438_t:CDS:2, partial [Scutellospora calospora]
LSEPKTHKKVICICKKYKGQKNCYDPQTRDTYIKIYGSYEFIADIQLLTIDTSISSQIESSSTKISSPSLIDLNSQQESDIQFLDLNISDQDEEVISEINEPESNNEKEKFIMNYSALDIDISNDNRFKSIKNLDRNFS